VTLKLWRISNHADLSGSGGLRAGGRWHSPGRPIVYAAEHPALALLETLVHLEIQSFGGLPSHYQLLEIDVPEGIPHESVSDSLIEGRWSEDIAKTRAIGDAWLEQRRVVLLGVPSAIVPKSRNWLVNPSHPDVARLAIVSVARFPFDRRMVKTRGSGARNPKT